MTRDKMPLLTEVNQGFPDNNLPAAGTAMRPETGWTVDRQVLRAVEAYVEEGWPILPLSPAGDHLVSGMVPPDARTAVEWWSDRPYGIGCRVGVKFDVMEMSSQLVLQRHLLGA